MKKSKLFAGLIRISLVFFISGFSFSNDRKAESRWTGSPLKVDGRNDEWRSDNLYSEKKPDVSYAFKNDGRSLYILFVFRNLKSLNSIEATGMTIYCNPEGINKKNNGIRFIKESIPVNQFITLLEHQGKVLTEEDKGFLRTRSQYPVFEAYEIDNERKVITPAGPRRPDVEPPAFCAAKKENIVTYEFRIPLAFGAPHPAGIGAEPGKPIKVCFEWGGSAKKILKAKASWPTPASLVSSDVLTGTGETRAQEFLSSFDAMSRPTLETKQYSFWVDVKLAANQ
jgi:hypothetical protein